MNKTREEVATGLLEIKAVKLQPKNPFTWASGWKSPIYCDNRKILSYPKIRKGIVESLKHTVITNFENVEVIAGVATGAIATGALVADLLDLPFVYIRSTAKDHGLENLIEGKLHPESNVIIIEDLISTGKSSLKAVQAIRNAGSNVIGMVANFTYGFDVATKAFEEANVEKLFTLTDYPTLLEVALKRNYISQEDLPTLEEWRKDAANWRNDLK
jgi:orotate phosphoribosyltransferase